MAGIREHEMPRAFHHATYRLATKRVARREHGLLLRGGAGVDQVLLDAKVLVERVL